MHYSVGWCLIHFEMAFGLDKCRGSWLLAANKRTVQFAPLWAGTRESFFDANGKSRRERREEPPVPTYGCITATLAQWLRVRSGSFTETKRDVGRSGLYSYQDVSPPKIAGKPARSKCTFHPWDNLCALVCLHHACLFCLLSPDVFRRSRVQHFYFHLWTRAHTHTRVHTHTHTRHRRWFAVTGL